MKLSVIIPSFNQARFIEKTFQNLSELKAELNKTGVSLEVLLFDSCSGEDVQSIIRNYSGLFDYLEVKKDKGQYDAINKGIARVTGDYWTWLNTDDLINIKGCLAIAEILKTNRDIDYIYGDIEVIDEQGSPIRYYYGKALTLFSLSNISSSINQPGSFFRRGFTEKTGMLKGYNCCFDYEYVLRLLKNNGRVFQLDKVVSQFRFYSTSKSGGIEYLFVNEQLEISKIYDRKFVSRLTYALYKRKLKLFVKSVFKIPFN